MIDPTPTSPTPLVTARQWAVSLAALGVIALATVGLRMWGDAAWSSYAAERSVYDAAIEAAQDASHDLVGMLRTGEEALETASSVIVAAAGFVEGDAVAALEEERAVVESIQAESATAGSWTAQPMVRLERTALLWEVLAETSTLSAATAELGSDRMRLNEVTVQLRSGVESLHADTIAVINRAGELGLEQLSQYPSATNDSFRALRDIAEGAAALTQVNYRADTIVADVLRAREAMASSHAEKEEAKAGPLKSVRDEIETFARSIAGGVRIDFTWQDFVIGHGQGRTAAGTATWDTADDGYSSITLTNSIARYWSSWSGYRNLVAHEVGHAITSKCYELFDVDLFAGDNERWATAWAIGMGYTVAAANGSDLYGVPSSAQIDATKACR